MKLLVVTSEPITAQQLREALGHDLDTHDTEVMVVAPALQESGFKFWLSDADDAIAKADEVRRQSVDELGDAGVPATGRIGESDPMQAIGDALNQFPAERILLFRREEQDQGYREDLDEGELEERFGLPVAQALTSR